MKVPSIKHRSFVDYYFLAKCNVVRAAELAGITMRAAQLIVNRLVSLLIGPSDAVWGKVEESRSRSRKNGAEKSNWNFDGRFPRTVSSRMRRHGLSYER